MRSYSLGQCLWQDDRPDCDESVSAMVNENTIDPNSAIQSAFEVDGIIKPTLERLGIVTVAQLAQLDDRDLGGISGVGEKKRFNGTLGGW